MTHRLKCSYFVGYETTTFQESKISWKVDVGVLAIHFIELVVEVQRVNDEISNEKHKYLLI